MANYKDLYKNFKSQNGAYPSVKELLGLVNPADINAEPTPSAEQLLGLGDPNPVPLMLRGVAPQIIEKEMEAPAPISRTPASSGLTSPSSETQIKEASKKIEEPVKSDRLEDTEYEDASEKARQDKLYAMLNSISSKFGDSVANVGASIGSGTKDNFGDVNQELVKNADSPLSALKMKREQYEAMIKNKRSREMNDPKSVASKSYQDLYRSLGGKVTGNETASELEEPIKYAQQKYSVDESKKNRALQLAMMKESKSQASDMKKESFIKDIRKEVVSSAAYKTALQGRRINEMLMKFNENPTGYSDYGTLMGALKALQGDESVIREAELKMGMQAGSLSDKISNEWSKAASGQMLQPEQRKAIIDAAKIMGDISAHNFESHANPYLLQAQRLGLPTNEIFPEFSGVGQSDSGVVTVTLKDGSQIKVKKDKLDKIDKADILKVE